MTREAMQQALEALINVRGMHYTATIPAEKAITALREALAQPEQRKPLTDEQVKELLLIGTVYAPDGVVTRTPFAYRKELLDTALWAFRKAEAAHNIKESK